MSNADRVVFPDDGITKGEVVAYYQEVGDRMLPYLAGRALSVERFPKGIGGEGFMQKNTPDHYPDHLFRRHPVPKEDGGTTTYPVIDSAEAIPYLANQGVITFHVPPVLVEDVTRPDWVTWDLDPPPGRPDLVRAAATELRSVLDSFGLATMPMTSGAKGYHLRARLKPGLDGDVVAEMARGIAELAAAAHPELMTTAFLKRERGDRVFVDWLRNAAYATAVSPWSLRARRGAPVAVPLEWDEIEGVDPDGVRLTEALRRSDPWTGSEPLDVAGSAEAVRESLRASGIELTPFDRFRG